MHNLRRHKNARTLEIEVRKKQTDKKTDRKIDRQTDRHTHKRRVKNNFLGGGNKFKTIGKWVTHK